MSAGLDAPRARTQGMAGDAWSQVACVAQTPGVIRGSRRGWNRGVHVPISSYSAQSAGRIRHGFSKKWCGREGVREPAGARRRAVRPPPGA